MKPRRFPRKRWIFLAALVLAAIAVWFFGFRATPLDPRFNGAYRLDDGRLVFVIARDGDTLRYSFLNGESRALWPAGENTFEAGPGWSDRTPVQVRVAFSPPRDGGYPQGFAWKGPDGAERRARRLDLPETRFTFSSGDLKLRGKLVAPQGMGPFPAVVIVHGSGRDSAVDGFYMPYLFASHGIATLVYDKRGTGGSDGDYTQNFHVLARDVLAAVDWLRNQPVIDASRIHLAGYSQGGWIAPLAASRTQGIRSVLVGYGPMVPITGEDRWGYVYALRQKGFGEDAIREADRINDVIGAIVDHGEDRWDELGRLLDESESKPWFEAVKGSDSAVGYVADTRLPLWALRSAAWWMTRPRGGEPFADRLYDPVPTVASLKETPSLWLLADEDESMPTGWTVDKLKELRKAGRPIAFEVYPGTDHGILRFEETPEGGRKYLGYHPEYLLDQVDWLRARSGLPPV